MRFLLGFLITIFCYGEYIPKINVVIDYDQETKSILGNSTQNYISDLTLAAKLIFRNELGIDLNIIQVREIKLTPNNINANLDLYKKYIESNTINGVQIYHLIQGGNLGLKGLGLSYQDGACTGKFGISTSKLSSFSFTVQTIVHEISHSIGATHDDTTANIMNSSNMSLNFNFTTISKNTIFNFIKKSCLSASKTNYPSIIWNRNGTARKFISIPNNSRIRIITGENANFKRKLSNKINRKNTFLVKVTNRNGSFYITNKILSSDLINNLNLIK